MIGTVKSVGFKLDRGFGFIAGDDGYDYYLHANELVDLEWSATLQERRVEFEVRIRDKGEAAVNVRAAA